MAHIEPCVKLRREERRKVGGSFLSLGIDQTIMRERKKFSGKEKNKEKRKRKKEKRKRKKNKEKMGKEDMWQRRKVGGGEVSPLLNHSVIVNQEVSKERKGGRN